MYKPNENFKPIADHNEIYVWTDVYQKTSKYCTMNGLDYNSFANLFEDTFSKIDDGIQNSIWLETETKY